MEKMKQIVVFPVIMANTVNPENVFSNQWVSSQQHSNERIKTDDYTLSVGKKFVAKEMKVLYNIVHLLCYAQLLKKIILEIKVPIFATADDDM